MLLAASIVLDIAALIGIWAGCIAIGGFTWTTVVFIFGNREILGEAAAFGMVCGGLLGMPATAIAAMALCMGY